MEIFIIRSTHVKTTFFETLGVLKCKKKCAQNFFEEYFFMGTGIDFSLINFYRVFSPIEVPIKKKYFSKNLCAPNFEN